MLSDINHMHPYIINYHVYLLILSEFFSSLCLIFFNLCFLLFLKSTEKVNKEMHKRKTEQYF